MRFLGLVPAIALLVFSPSVQAQGRLLTVLFGPGSAETARQGARAAAATAHHWLKTVGSEVEVRRAGSADIQRFDSRMPAKQMEQAFVDTALQARAADPAAFLTALDNATQEAALHPGPRVVVAVLNSPPLSSEAERTLANLVEFCRTKGVRVIVLDVAPEVKSEANAALEALATNTGGMWLRKPGALESSVMMVAAVKGKAEAPAAAATAATPAAEPTASAAKPSSGSGTGLGIPFEIQVHARFVRTSGAAAIINGNASQSAGSDHTTTASFGERAYEANESTGPMRGLLIVESPLNALRFETDDTAGAYLARARIAATVRNSKGAAVWNGQKEVNVRGPLRRLDTRRQGSLFFMRGVTLPGGERYTLEARVEDLVTGSSGRFQGPVRPGQGAPGLMASDAFFVRRFSGSADRFEADQVFSYEGEALSPVLNPVFSADQAINLQLYFVVYPDINGAQPDLSLELLRDGRSVARMPLQFNSPIRQGGMDGRGAMLLGGRSHEFPFLANLKDMKLSPGTYEGIVSIRQGRNVITRNVTFQVVGKGPAPAEAAAATRMKLGEQPDTAAAPKVTLGADTAVVALPAIEPATVDSSGLAMSREEQERLWEEAAGNALGYSSHLPNFRCLQETHRFSAPVKNPEQLKETDTFRDELMYEDGKETYRRIEVDGAAAEAPGDKMKRVRSQGEFGSLLRGLFDPESAANYKWAGRAMAMGVLCQVFDVEVAKGKSNFSLKHNDNLMPVGYKGQVFIDEDTGLVRRLTIQGTGLSKGFPMQSPAFSLEYGMVRIGADDHLLPLRSVLQVQHLKLYVRNETVFRDYRRFEASTEIKFHNR